MLQSGVISQGERLKSTRRPFEREAVRLVRSKKSLKIIVNVKYAARPVCSYGRLKHKTRTEVRNVHGEVYYETTESQYFATAWNNTRGIWCGRREDEDRILTAGLHDIWS